MGRKAGGKNFENLVEEPKQPTVVPQSVMDKLHEIFTKIDKDIITISDFMEHSGLSYDICAKMIRQIKGVSDTFGIKGCVHRADYFVYLTFRFKVQENKEVANAGCV